MSVFFFVVVENLAFLLEGEEDVDDVVVDVDVVDDDVDDVVDVGDESNSNGDSG